jgi:hypothetical protein
VSSPYFISPSGCTLSSPQQAVGYSANSFIKRVTRDDKPDTLKQLKHRLSALKEEEAQLGRLLITGKISEMAYDQLRLEWHEKVLNIKLKIEELEFDASQYFDDLEMSLTLISQISILYDRLEDQLRTNLLQMVVKRIIINRDGEIIHHELHSPFDYLSTLATNINENSEESSGSEQVRYGSLETPTI